MEVLFTIRPLVDFNPLDRGKAVANTSQLVRRLVATHRAAENAAAEAEAVVAAGYGASDGGGGGSFANDHLGTAVAAAAPAPAARPPRFLFCTAPSSLPPFSPVGQLLRPPPGLLHWSPSLPASFAHRALFAQDTRWAPVHIEHFKDSSSSSNSNHNYTAGQTGSNALLPGVDASL
jgi:hypothetical protein